MSKEKKVSQHVSEDYVTNKLLSVFTVAFVLIIGVMFFSRMMQRSDTLVSAMNGVQILSIVLLAATVVCAIVAIISKVKGKDQKYKLLTAKHLAIVLGFATCCFGALAFAFAENTVSLLYVIIPTITVLFIIYNTYARDFFALSAICAVGALGIWLIGSAISDGMGASKLYLIIAAVAVAMVALIVGVIVLNVSGGKFGKKRVFDQGAKYSLLYIAIALALALIAATIIMVGAAMYYFLFIMLAYFVVAGIYYTLKMI